MTPFSVIELPLEGSRLIEASAGTGKTWTIAALMVRLVVGHGCAPRHPRDILVMTFTRAATRELATRIRARLHQALSVFEGRASPQGDTLLEGLLPLYPAGTARGHAIQRLRDALQTIDEAAVQTIDAWCQRMLREHAFDSGSRFDETLVPDESAVKRSVRLDYWRREVLSLPPPALEVLMSIWSDVGSMHSDLDRLDEGSTPSTEAPPPLASLWDAWSEERHRAWQQLQEGLSEILDETASWCEAVRTNRQHPHYQLLPQAGHLRNWWSTLRVWAAQTEPPVDCPLTESAQARLQALAAASRGLHDPTRPPAMFQRLADLPAAVASQPSLRQQLLRHALQWTEAAACTAKQEAGWFGFSDLLQRLHKALLQPEAGPRLAARIRAQYPVALIDEFQDTSPVQLQIFDRVFSIAQPAGDTTLLLIGDPKQAIYRFRGADIHSYLHARGLTEGRHHVLDTNFRSSPALVSAVNALFEAAEHHCPQGAFRFREGVHPIPFQPVRSRPVTERLVWPSTQQPVAPITVAFDGVLRRTEDSRVAMAQHCAAVIAQCLGPEGAAMVPASATEGAVRPLQAGDIAVLVLSGKEADTVRAALAQQGIDSVYLSDHTSVWTSEEAEDLLLLLQAVAHPRDPERARRAFATALFNHTPAELCALADDDAWFDARCRHWSELLEVWQTHGVLATLRRAVHCFGLQFSAARERSLTNLLHLGELLQHASIDHPEPASLLQWLEHALHSEGTPPEETLMRLESDAQRVQIVTVHKSKGLEYPVVFLPFATHARQPVSLPSAGAKVGGATRFPAFMLPCTDPPGAPPERVWNPGAEHYALENLERDREALRLLYVALTRARHAVWIGAALAGKTLKQCAWPRSALGYLLSAGHRAASTGQGSEGDDPTERWWADLQRWHAAVPAIVVERVGEAPAKKGSTPSLPASLPPLRPALQVGSAIDHSWSLTSYSALVRDLSRSSVPNAPALDRPGLDEELAAPISGPHPAEAPWHRFPRGATAGTLLHDLLEWLAGEGFALTADSPLATQLLRRCERWGWTQHGPDALAWLVALVAQPLPPWGVPLRQLQTTVPEMEFWLPVEPFHTEALDALCRRHALPDASRPALPARTLRGFLMGFADLVIEREGRYWVLDYKSNVVGTATAPAAQDLLERAVLDHRYDVQGALYLWALHCLLRSRLGADYRPEEHLGGVIFLFLREWEGPTQGCCVLPATAAWMEDLTRVLPLPQRSAP